MAFCVGLPEKELGAKPLFEAVLFCDVWVTGVLTDRFDGERSSRKSASRVVRLVASIRI